jgi:SHS family lactate transporter-like MFS transporter
MTAFNFFSHGTQDLYPTFLKVQHGFGPHEVGLIAVIYNVGAIIGGISFGSLSERFGRRRIIIIAAVLSLVVLPLWAFAASAVWLAIGAFLMQVMVQGAWGVIPVHLNELSPDDSRGTFPGFVYRLGNLIASFNATLHAGVAAHFGGNYMPWRRSRGGYGCGRDRDPYRFRHRSKRRGIRNRSHPRPGGSEDRGEFGCNLI